MEALLKIKNLTKMYNKDKGIKDVNIELYEGKIIGITGHSGSGKTTLIKSIIDSNFKDIGNVYYYGKEVNMKSNIYKELGYVSQDDIEVEKITIENLLKYSMSYYNIDFTNDILNYIRLFNLNKNEYIYNLSKGELKILSFIICVMHKPKLIILDEFDSNLDNNYKHLIIDILNRFKANNSSIILTSHDFSLLQLLADDIYIIDHNKLNKVNKKILNKNYKKVNLICNKYYDYNNFKINNIENLKINNEYIEFIYKEDLNKLLKQLLNYDIVDININNLNILDIELDKLYEN